MSNIEELLKEKEVLMERKKNIEDLNKDLIPKYQNDKDNGVLLHLITMNNMRLRRLKRRLDEIDNELKEEK